MLLADHALDLRGLPVQHLADGRVRIARQAVSQVLPRDGRYGVLCMVGGSSGTTGTRRRGA